MNLKSVKIELEFAEDEDLNSVFFWFENDNYFGISRMEEDDDLYLIKDNQETGTYAELNAVKYELSRNKLALTLNEEVANEIKTDQEVIISFEADEEIFKGMETILKEIFS